MACHGGCRPARGQRLRSCAPACCGAARQECVCVWLCVMGGMHDGQQAPMGTAMMLLNATPPVPPAEARHRQWNRGLPQAPAARGAHGAPPRRLRSALHQQQPCAAPCVLPAAGGVCGAACHLLCALGPAVRCCAHDVLARSAARWAMMLCYVCVCDEHPCVVILNCLCWLWNSGGPVAPVSAVVCRPSRAGGQA